MAIYAIFSLHEQEKLCIFAVVIEIGRHIEILLLNSDCVMVPGLGGFVAHNVEARYNEADDMFLPPLRTLGFNQQLQVNDSLLAQSYMSAYDLSYPEALRRIKGEVEELNNALDNEGHYELLGIGTFRKGAEGNLEFEPCDAGILTPALYGLSVVGIKPVETSTKEIAPVVEVPVSEEREAGNRVPEERETEVVDDDGKYVKIKVAWIRNAVAAAAVIAAIFIISFSLNNSNSGTVSLGTLDGGILSQLMPKDSQNTIDISPLQEKDKMVATDTTVNKAVVDKNSEKADTVLSAAEDGGYTLILASCVSRKNADIFINMLKEGGHDGAYKFEKNDILRVGYGNFSSETEAYNQLRKLSGEKYFDQAWVFKK